MASSTGRLSAAFVLQTSVSRTDLLNFQKHLVCRQKATIRRQGLRSGRKLVIYWVLIIVYIMMMIYNDAQLLL